jgi:hypothetical protein
MLKSFVTCFVKEEEEGEDNSKVVATLALGSRPRQRGCKVVGQEKDPRVTSHIPRSAKECEGMNLHIPK